MQISCGVNASVDWREIQFQALTIQKTTLKKKKKQQRQQLEYYRPTIAHCAVHTTEISSLGSIHKDLSFVVMWINLECVMQSEVNQKGKN